MIIDDRIVKSYLNGFDMNEYKDDWIYKCFGSDSVFESPSNKHREWVAKLYDKLLDQITHFKPRNSQVVKSIFTNFDDITHNYTIMLVVGFPAPYDAMVLNHNGKEYMVFDLIQFGKDSLKEDYSCHRVLTHELIHLCLHQYYPAPTNPSYIDQLNYKSFDEGFAHALSYPEDILSFTLDDFHLDKFNKAKKTFDLAIRETNPIKQAVYLTTADAGSYWNKFAAISGKLYLLNNINHIEELFKQGWADFTDKIFLSK